jgi:hypothetical protein
MGTIKLYVGGGHGTIEFEVPSADAAGTDYVPDDPAAWPTPPPSSVSQALDTLIHTGVYGGAQAHYMCEGQSAFFLADGAKSFVPPWYSIITVAPFGPSIAGLRALRPGFVTTLHCEFFGDSSNPVGSKVLIQLEYGATVVPGSQILLDAANPLTQSGTVTFPPFPYDPSDVMRLTMTPPAGRARRLRTGSDLDRSWTRA